MVSERTQVRWSSEAKSTWENHDWSSQVVFTIGPVDPRQVIQGVQGKSQQAADVVSAGVSIPADAKNWEGSAITGVVENASPITNGVAGRFYAVAKGDGNGVDDHGRVSVWGVNTLMADQGHKHVLLVNELDINIKGPDTKAIGLSVGGNGTQRPAPGSICFMANTLGGKGKRIPWPVGFGTLPGTARIFASVGPTSGKPGAGSQPIILNARDAQGRPESCRLEFKGGKLVIKIHNGDGTVKRKVIEP